jgi:hypothetical protein
MIPISRTIEEGSFFAQAQPVAVGGFLAEEEGLYDTADAWFLESFEEVVEVDGAVFDEVLDGLMDEGNGDGRRGKRGGGG